VTSAPRSLFDLLVITDGGPNLVSRIDAALSNCVHRRVAVMLRDKQATSGPLLTIATQLRALTRARGAFLIVNDRVDVALACGADGVHLPESGFSIEATRALVGQGRWVGVSRHDETGLAAARSQGADYATLSPVGLVPGKGEPLTAGRFAAIARGETLPLFALGGVGIDDVDALIRGGARGIAVIREVLAAQAPGERVRALLRAMDEARLK